MYGILRRADRKAGSSIPCDRCGSEQFTKGGRNRQARQLYRCGTCGRRLTPRSASAFSGYRFPDDSIALAVLWYLRFRLPYADVAELFAERGVHVDPSTIFDWVQQFTPLYQDAARPHRRRVGDQWSIDITYVPMRRGFLYLVAVLDWFSRYVLAWNLSNTLDGYFCVEALQHALDEGTPAIFNTDQGVQFTAANFTRCLLAAGIRISMDGRGRALDNIFVERLWRSVKYEDIYLKEYASVPELEVGLEHYFRFYNHERPHQSLGYRTPAEVHYA